MDLTPAPIQCYHNSLFAVVLTEGSLFLLLGSLFYRRFLKARDAYFIRLEILLCLSFSFPIQIIWAVSYKLDWAGVPLQHFWLSLADIGFLTAGIAFPVCLTRVFSGRIRRQKVSSASVDDEIRLVIGDTDLGPCFERFAISSWAVENLVFYKRVQVFQLLSDPSHLAEEARVIYNEFVAIGKRRPLCCCWVVPPLEPFSLLGTRFVLPGQFGHGIARGHSGGHRAGSGDARAV